MYSATRARFHFIRPVQCRLRSTHRTRSTSKEGELSWDPEGLFGPAETGLIERRMMQKRMEKDKEFATKITQAQSELEQKAIARRTARTQPEGDSGLIEYFLNTDMEDMQYEVTRWRRKLTPDFFTLLDSNIGTERFGQEPNEERLAELESLRAYLEEATKVIDETVAKSGNAVERFKKLLTAKDKKATILEMVAANEIDTLLVDVMNENIEEAIKAKENKKAEYMEKLRDACKRYC